MTVDVTVCIPTIAQRAHMLDRAIASIAKGSAIPRALSVQADLGGWGAGPTRQRTLHGVATEWVAFLDDDDEFGADHLRRLLAAAEETGADVVFPWFVVVGGQDPFPQHFGRQWDPADPHIFPITTLVRTEAIARAGAEFPAYPGGDWTGADLPFWHAIAEAGGTFHHLPERTWLWHHHGRGPGGNTSGQASVVASWG